MSTEHQHEAWQIRDDGRGQYCAACGQHLGIVITDADCEDLRTSLPNNAPNPAPVDAHLVPAVKRIIDREAKRLCSRLERRLVAFESTTGSWIGAPEDDPGEDWRAGYDCAVRAMAREVRQALPPLDRPEPSWEPGDATAGAALCRGFLR